ncbi:hypothetical protein GTY75_03935 [Streptomyces sp. SID8381]|uniref:hypothetical protein n=1 Tax=unclassified Streptomyces TaxID=2593676 RepID=UPI000379C9F7|nr:MULTISPECIES: hypothetical protein [unclassified Streptomyces]MYX25828.1 hypothetical protein [Streptomyces sp. SID8381]
MAATCVFCGSADTLTGEHVLGDWLSKIGLDLDPVPHGAGWLNRIGRELGVRPPFRQKVRDVCGDCNHGWMSRLEVAAQRVLTPLILGHPGRIEAADQGAIAAWVQKTALTAMLVSSEADRDRGYGLPVSEYHELYALRDELRPLPASLFWAGRYEGVRGWSIRVTPLAVRVDGLPEPDRPQAYAVTILLGQLVLQGVRFTTASLQVELSTRLELPEFWPLAGPVTWPSGTPLEDDGFLDFAGGKGFRSTEQHIHVQPWKRATELEPSRAVGGMVELPTICGKHVVYYPAALVGEAMRGRFYAFGTACECPMAYLIHTEPDGAHCKAADTAEGISELYEALPGTQYEIEDDDGSFWCKRLPSPFQQKMEP